MFKDWAILKRKDENRPVQHDDEVEVLQIEKDECVLVKEMNVVVGRRIVYLPYLQQQMKTCRQQCKQTPSFLHNVIRETRSGLVLGAFLMSSVIFVKRKQRFTRGENMTSTQNSPLVSRLTCTFS